MSAGNGFVVVLGTDGSVWAWGTDGYGQLGIGPIFGPPIGRPVEPIKPGSGIIQIAVGEMHVLAVKSNRTVLAWGRNQAGELGNGTSGTPSGPVQATGLTNATRVAAGWAFSLALYVPQPVATQ